MSVETTSYLAMLERMIKAAGKRVGEADEVELAALVRLHNDLDRAITSAVEAQRASGSSWAQLGRGLGLTRQGAQQRYGERSAA